MNLNNNKSEKPNSTSKLLAISILALAASLAWFTFELSQFIRQIPDILENVRQTSEQIEPVLDEVAQIRKLVKPVLVEVNTISDQIPSILLEVKNIRESIPPILKSIPPVLEETASLRKALPPILNEVGAIRKQLPDVLNAVDKASTTISRTTAEINAWQPIAKETLLQIEGTRKEIPTILDRSEAMIGQARVAARDASSGVITGALGGLLTAPFRLVGSFSSSVLELTSSEASNYSEEDLEKLKAHSLELLQNGALGDSSKWENSETKRRAQLTLQKIYQDDDDQPCREILIKSWLESELTLEKAITACQNEDGEWEDQD